MSSHHHHKSDHDGDHGSDDGEKHGHLDHFKKVIEDHKKVAIGVGVGAGVIAVGALLAGGAYAWHQHSETEGQNKSKTRLHVKLHSATDLLAKEDDGESSPFVVMKIGRATVKSKVSEKNLNPTWDQEFEVGIIPGKDDSLYLEVLDKDSFLHSTLGNAEIDLRGLSDAPSKFSPELKGGGKHNHGKVHLSLHISQQS